MKSKGSISNIGLVMLAERGFALVALWLALLCAVSDALWAATLTVTSLADAGPGTLRQAIADATSGDTIDFTVTGNIEITNGTLLIGKSIQISGPGPSRLAVVATTWGTLFLTSNAVITVSGITITSEGNSYPRVILNTYTSALTLSNCVVTRTGNSSPLLGTIRNNAG